MRISSDGQGHRFVEFDVSQELEAYGQGAEDGGRRLGSAEFGVLSLVPD